MPNVSTPVFAPELYIPNGVKDIDFYINGLGAIELRRFANTDGSIHVSELSIAGAIFHLHEEVKNSSMCCPAKHQGSTVKLGLFVDDVDVYIARAVAAGAKVVSPAQDYDYGYRQGDIMDPFGHVWMFESRI